jgi:hypothetical protein
MGQVVHNSIMKPVVLEKRRRVLQRRSPRKNGTPATFVMIAVLPYIIHLSNEEDFETL